MAYLAHTYGMERTANEPTLSVLCGNDYLIKGEEFEQKTIIALKKHIVKINESLKFRN